MAFHLITNEIVLMFLYFCIYNIVKIIILKSLLKLFIREITEGFHKFP